MSKSGLLLTVVIAAVGSACDEDAAPSFAGGKHTDRVTVEQCTNVGWTVEAVLGDKVRCAPPAIATRADCASFGADSVPLGREDDDRETCFLPTPDGGAYCNDTSECAGFCEAPPGASPRERHVGTCSYHTQELCWTALRRGRPADTGCI
jgi:hypothetical protein